MGFPPVRQAGAGGALGAAARAHGERVSREPYGPVLPRGRQVPHQGARRAPTLHRRRAHCHLAQYVVMAQLLYIRVFLVQGTLGTTRTSIL